MGLTSAQRHNRMMDNVFRRVEAIDKKAKCPKCKKLIKRMRGLGTLTEVCTHCGFTRSDLKDKIKRRNELLKRNKAVEKDLMKIVRGKR